MTSTNKSKNVLLKTSTVFSCCLHNFVVAISGRLLYVYLSWKKLNGCPNCFHFYLHPDYFLAGGSALGCIMSPILIKNLESRGSLNFIKLILLIWPLFYYLNEKEKIDFSEYQNMIMVAILFIQGFLESSSLVVTSVYLMEVLRTPRERSFLIVPAQVAASHVPYKLAEILPPFFHMRYRHLYEIGYAAMMAIAIFFSVISVRPKMSSKKTPSPLEKCEIPRKILACCGLVLLARLSGSDAYRFYTIWSLRPHPTANHHHSTEMAFGVNLASHRMFTSCVEGSCALVGLLVLTWIIRGPRAVIAFCIISTASISTCLFATGWLLQASSNDEPFIWRWSPLVLYMVFTVAYNVGLGSVFLPLSSLIAPKTCVSKTIALVVLIHCLVGHLSSRVTPTLISLLQPFGLFWLYSSLTFIGLIYLGLVVGPEMKHSLKSSIQGGYKERLLREVTKIEQIITQV